MVEHRLLGLKVFSWLSCFKGFLSSLEATTQPVKNQKFPYLCSTQLCSMEKRRCSISLTKACFHYCFNSHHKMKEIRSWSRQCAALSICRASSLLPQRSCRLKSSVRVIFQPCFQTSEGQLSTFGSHKLLSLSQSLVEVNVYAIYS